MAVMVSGGVLAAEPSATGLAEGFRNPGNEARPRAYWNWLNGAVTHSALTRDLEEAKAKGMACPTGCWCCRINATCRSKC
jgi:hypothetical protein